MRALTKLTWVETKLFFREPLAVLFALAFPFVLLFVLGEVFGNSLDRSDPNAVKAWDGAAPTTYLLPAYLGLVLASIGLLALPIRLATYRETGVLRRFRAAGLPMFLVITAQIGVGIAVAALGGIAITIVSRLVYATPFPRSLSESVAAFLLAALVFSAVGVMLAAILRTPRAAQGAGLLLFFVDEFLGGAGPPRGVLSAPMLAISKVLPLTHVIYLLQGSWLSWGWDWPATLAAVITIAIASAVALVRFRWD